jgi:hypothetical protein
VKRIRSSRVFGRLGNKPGTWATIVVSGGGEEAHVSLVSIGCGVCGWWRGVDDEFVGFGGGPDVEDDGSEFPRKIRRARRTVRMRTSRRVGGAGAMKDQTEQQ